jgi:predicted enzyme related to lactoylglutathione lyase
MTWRSRNNDNAGAPHAPFWWVFPERDGDPVRIEFGESGHRLIRGMHRALAALALAGNDVIVEHVLLYEEWKRDLLEALKGLSVCTVGIECPIEVLEERERTRGDAVIGQALAHHETVHANLDYDMRIDTSAMEPRAAAEVIARHAVSMEYADTGLFQKIDCLQIPVSDLEAGLAFYRDKLGHELIWRTETAAGLRMPETDAEIVVQTERPQMEANLKVASADAAVERIVEAGGKLVAGPFEIQIGRCAVVLDPWGNPLVLLDASKGRLVTDVEGRVTGVEKR